MTLTQINQARFAYCACEDVHDWLVTLQETPDLTHEGHHCVQSALSALATVRANLSALTHTG
jgi:hypothetical protein